MKMTSRVVQLCIDMSIWSMAGILRLGRIQVKRRLLGLRLKYVVKVDKALKIEERTSTKSSSRLIDY